MTTEIVYSMDEVMSVIMRTFRDEMIAAMQRENEREEMGDGRSAVEFLREYISQIRVDGPEEEDGETGRRGDGETNTETDARMDGDGAQALRTGRAGTEACPRPSLEIDNRKSAIDNPPDPLILLGPGGDFQQALVEGREGLTDITAAWRSNHVG